MAKKSKTDLVKLTSTGINKNGKLTGTSFVKKRNATRQPTKLSFRKYDSKAVFASEEEYKNAGGKPENATNKKPGMHVLFIEKKMPNPKA